MPACEKFRELLLGTEAATTSPVSGRLLGRLIGKWTSYLLLRRELFSVLRRVYTYLTE